MRTAATVPDGRLSEFAKPEGNTSAHAVALYGNSSRVWPESMIHKPSSESLGLGEVDRSPHPSRAAKRRGHAKPGIRIRLIMWRTIRGIVLHPPPPRRRRFQEIMFYMTSCPQPDAVVHPYGRSCRLWAWHTSDLVHQIHMGGVLKSSVAWTSSCTSPGSVAEWPASGTIRISDPGRAL